MRIALIYLSKPQSLNDISSALARAGMSSIELQQDAPLWEVSDIDGYVILGEGAISISDSQRSVLCAESEKNKPILGISGGAHILAQTGLVPGLENYRVGISLSTKHCDKKDLSIRLAKNYQRNAFTRYLSTDMFFSAVWPEEIFVVPPALRLEMQEQGQLLFEYVDSAPVEAVAAVSNKAGNVLAMLPRIENVSLLDALFSSMRDHVSAKHKEKVSPLNYYPRGNL